MQPSNGGRVYEVSPHELLSPCLDHKLTSFIWRQQLQVKRCINLKERIYRSMSITFSHAFLVSVYTSLSLSTLRNLFTIYREISLQGLKYSDSDLALQTFKLQPSDPNWCKTCSNALNTFESFLGRLCGPVAFFWWPFKKKICSPVRKMKTWREVVEIRSEIKTFSEWTNRFECVYEYLADLKCWSLI